MGMKMRQLPEAIGSFRVIKDLGMRKVGINGRGRFAIVECPHCKCHKEVDANKYKSNTPNSCGCKANELKSINSAQRTHGGVGTRLYTIWEGIRRRTLNPNEKEALIYAGISLCDEWNDFAKFREWSNKNGYSDSLTIDRIDGNGNYEPGNCRWTTKSVQASNRNKKRGKVLPKGIHLNGNNYSAKITVDGIEANLGVFKTIRRAVDKLNQYIVDNKLEERYSKSIYNGEIKTLPDGVKLIGDKYHSYALTMDLANGYSFGAYSTVKGAKTKVDEILALNKDELCIINHPLEEW